MAMETTLLIVKPDGVQRGLVGEILGRFERRGLQLVGLKLMKISPDLAARHYAEHKERPFYAGLVRFMTSSPVVVFAVRGKGAVAMCRKMMGKTFCPESEPGSIRGDLGVSRAYNLIHGSDSPEAAQRELGLFFSAGEILDWQQDAITWQYDAAEELA